MIQLEPLGDGEISYQVHCERLRELWTIPRIQKPWSDLRWKERSKRIPGPMQCLIPRIVIDQLNGVNFRKCLQRLAMNLNHVFQENVNPRILSRWNGLSKRPLRYISCRLSHALIAESAVEVQVVFTKQHNTIYNQPNISINNSSYSD